MGSKAIHPGSSGTIAFSTCRKDEFGVPTTLGKAMATPEGAT
jgi:hypothetical protein